jgi:hypothetical protein
MEVKEVRILSRIIKQLYIINKRERIMKIIVAIIESCNFVLRGIFKFDINRIRNIQPIQKII